MLTVAITSAFGSDHFLGDQLLANQVPDRLGARSVVALGDERVELARSSLSIETPKPSQFRHGASVARLVNS